MSKCFEKKKLQCCRKKVVMLQEKKTRKMYVKKVLNL